MRRQRAIGRRTKGCRFTGTATRAAVASTLTKGSWNFDLKWRGPENVSIFDAIDHQLVLKLQTQKVPTTVIMVDRVARRPTENPPGVATSLPPPPPAKFEVAVIKPSMPGENPRLRT